MTRKHILLPNAQPIITWDKAFKYANQYYANDTFAPHFQPVAQYSLAENQESNPTIENSFILSAFDKAYPTIGQTLIKKSGLQSIYQDKLDEGREMNVSLYFSILSHSYTHGIHRDATDAIIWQQQGITQVDVYDDKLYSYNLSPGDIIWIPEGMYHNTTPLTHRISISFAFFRPNSTGVEHIEDKDFYTKQGIDLSGYVNPFE